MNPYKVVQDFEEAIAEYTGSKYAVAVSSCTEAIMLACAYHIKVVDEFFLGDEDMGNLQVIFIPKRTYVGVPMSIIHAGGVPRFDNRKWVGEYQLKPYPIWDSAKLLTSGMYRHGQMQCLSLHWTKTLSVGWGGVIIHDDKEADTWFRRARFDGRKEGVKPVDDKDLIVGWHCMMSPAQAAEALTRLSFLPKHNEPLTDNYPDLSTYKAFQ
jgi:dTDP-4-amino-4,6-dideoxygalactose transaminase